MSYRDLNPQQQCFVDEYSAHFDGKRAAIAAGYSEKSAMSLASQLLKNPKVAKAIQENLEEFGENNLLLKQKIINELSLIAFNDHADFYNEHGALKPIRELKRKQSSAIKEIKIKRTFSEKFGDCEEITLKTWSKEKALELLARHVGVVNDHPEPKVTSKNDQKISFEDFCANANYPVPFAKQIEMKQFGINNTGSRMILGARGYGKTDYVTSLGVAYEIYLDPTYTALIITKSSERNAAILKEIAKACEKNGIAFEINNSTALRVTGLIGKDHSVSAATINSVTLRGRHPKMIIMDDPVTPDDSSEAVRKKAKSVYNELTKLNSNVLLIGQPVHKFDLYSELRDTIPCMEVPHGTIPELDADLEAQRLACVDEASIQASYFLKVVSEGTVPFDQIKYLEKYPLTAQTNSVAFIDPAFGGSDYTAVTILTGYLGGMAIVGFAWKKSWEHCLDDMAKAFGTFHVKRCAFETNKTGDQPLDTLRTAFGVGVVGIFSNTNKHSRIMAAGAHAHNLHLSRESNKDYIDQLVRYEYNAKNDDAPDSLASCLAWLGLIWGKE